MKLKISLFGILLLLIACSRSKINTPVKEKGLKTILALGDSYTKGESVLWSLNFPNQLIDSLNKSGFKAEVKIIAQTGWRTDNLKDAINQESLQDTFDMVTLLIGVNNQFQGRSLAVYKVEFEDLLKTAIKLAQGNTSKVVVLSIPDYGYTTFGKNNQPAISESLATFNEANKTITDSYTIKYINITDITQKGLEDPDLVADDGLHPSAKAYNLFVKRLYLTAEAILNQ